MAFRMSPSDLEEATRIRDLLQADMDQKFDELRKDKKKLTAYVKTQERWDELVEELKAIKSLDDDPPASKPTATQPTPDNQSAASPKLADKPKGKEGLK